MVKKILRGIGISLECFFAFLFLYAIIAVLGAVIPTGHVPKDGEVVIYVQSNGVHTDVCFPSINDDMDWTKFIQPEEFTDNRQIDYITIGWGDKGFFLDTPTWADLKTSTAINAAFLPSPTAMHVWYTGEPILTDSRRRVSISRENYRKMVKYAKSYFKRKGNDVQLIPNSGYTQRDNFYEAFGNYHCFNTCNSFTNGVLKQGGVRTGVLALFPDGILRHLD